MIMRIFGLRLQKREGNIWRASKGIRKVVLWDNQITDDELRDT